MTTHLSFCSAPFGPAAPLVSPLGLPPGRPGALFGWPIGRPGRPIMEPGGGGRPPVVLWYGCIGAWGLAGWPAGGLYRGAVDASSYVGGGAGSAFGR